MLPGFTSDAISFATRTTIALMLAYLFSFVIQLDSASSAGVCVAIVAQPSTGMALSKAIWRMMGTVLGGLVALCFVAAFPQDRTMLLLCFAVWLSFCTFVAAFLRDFRAYGAVLCGYTGGIIAIGGIDSPDTVLIVMLDRVAAVLIGILSVALVNATLPGPSALSSLTDALQQHLAETRAISKSILLGQIGPFATAAMATGAAVSELRVQASYIAAELAGGGNHRRGALNAISGLLGMLSACRALDDATLFSAMPPIWDDWRKRALLALQTDMPTILSPIPNTPTEAFAVERVNELLAWHARVVEGLNALKTGGHSSKPPRLHVHYDVVGAAISAVRTTTAVLAGAIFCIYSGWPSSSGVLVWQAIFTALLSMQANPTDAASAMAWSLPLPAFAAGLVGYVLLPHASGFAPFTLAIIPCAFGLSLISRHHRFLRLSAGLMLYFTLLLAPTNTESFDLSSFLNNVLIQLVAIGLVLVAFVLILPVSRSRRLMRIAISVMTDLRKASLGQARRTSSTTFLPFDRFSQLKTLPARPTLARGKVLGRIAAMMDLEQELRRLKAGMKELPSSRTHEVWHLIAVREPSVLHGAAIELLKSYGKPSLVAVSALYAIARLFAKHGQVMQRYGVW